MVRASINYLDRAVQAPYQYLCEPPAGEAIDNFRDEVVPVDVQDISGIPLDEQVRRGWTTEQAGFQIVQGFGAPDTQAAWADGRWDDDEWLRAHYYDDVTALLRKELGITSTFIFDHTVRKSGTDHLPDTPENRKPVPRAHCDQSRRAGEHRIRKHLGEDVLARVQRGELHCQLVNVWRPLRGPVEEFPLAVADSRSVDRGENGGTPDWIASELRYETWSGETLLIHHNPKHQWYYYKGIDTDKSIFLKTYDSKTETRTPHTAFVDPSSRPNPQPRWSVEVRVLCFTEMQPSAAQ